MSVQPGLLQRTVESEEAVQQESGATVQAGAEAVADIQEDAVAHRLVGLV